MSVDEDRAARNRLPIPVHANGCYRTPEQSAHAASFMAAFSGRGDLALVWCEWDLNRRAGKWADFTGPQSVMTARFHELARQLDERTATTYDIGFASRDGNRGRFRARRWVA